VFAGFDFILFTHTAQVVRRIDLVDAAELGDDHVSASVNTLFCLCRECDVLENGNGCCLSEVCVCWLADSFAVFGFGEQFNVTVYLTTDGNTHLTQSEW
jgi:hypothetical protein